MAKERFLLAKLENVRVEDILAMQKMDLVVAMVDQPKLGHVSHAMKHF